VNSRQLSKKNQLFDRNNLILFFIVQCSALLISHTNKLNKSPLNWKENEVISTIHLITPTYFRHTQMADLTRMGQTLLLVPRLHWILIEDSINQTNQVIEFVDHIRSLAQKYDSDLKMSHLYEPTPPQHQRRPNEKYYKRPRGVSQRNRALQYLESMLNQSRSIGGDVVYFADDDNTYDVRLFEQMRNTRSVSIWPVALVGGLLVEKPIVDSSTGLVTGFNAQFKPNRAYPTDMAGFAVNWSLLAGSRNVRFLYNLSIGHLESNFLQQILEGRHELEPKADLCSKVYVWHTQTVAFRPTH
jgi:galactosylgalactosylxylosylprotein 3-beta-glucuronosyltransferase 3